MAKEEANGTSVKEGVSRDIAALRARGFVIRPKTEDEIAGDLGLAREDFENARKRSRRWSEAEKHRVARRVARASANGETKKEVCLSYGVDRRTVGEWINRGYGRGEEDAPETETLA